MIQTESFPLIHSWPLSQASREFELGHVLNAAVTDALQPIEVGVTGLYHAGLWECDLATNSLVWSGGTYDIFGLPRNASINRSDAISLYAENSRVALERLRAHCIKHRRGFTLDAEVNAANGQVRWMRLIAAPVCDGDCVTRLHGLKLMI